VNEVIYIYIYIYFYKISIELKQVSYLFYYLLYLLNYVLFNIGFCNNMTQKGVDIELSLT
jgi:hypothetical protein